MTSAAGIGSSASPILCGALVPEDAVEQGTRKRHQGPRRLSHGARSSISWSRISRMLLLYRDILTLA